MVDKSFTQKEKIGNSINSDLEKVNSEVRELRLKLNEVGAQKEKWFLKKEELNKQISDIIGEVKDNKDKRDSLTGKVKESKVQRRDYHKNIVNKISQIKKLSKEKREIMSKHKIKDDPSKIKADIDNLELKIETEVMSFGNEKKLMDKIRLLKKKYAEAKKVSTVFESVNKLSKEVDEMRRKSDEVHRVVQNQAKQSQEKHENILNKSDDVKCLRTEENKAFAKFVGFKKEFAMLNLDLRVKLAKLNEISGKLNAIRQDSKKKKKDKEKRTLKLKEEDVEKKIKERKRLTTEDLLVFQKSAK